MKKSFYPIAFVLALAAAYAVSQTAPAANQARPSSTQQSSSSATTPAQPEAAAQPAASLSTPAENADLQVKIGSALKSEPTLSTSNVLVNVSGDTVELSGSVPTGKEKITAKRIAQSFAGNLKVVDRITVTGRGNGPVTTNPSSTTTPPPDNQPQTPKR